MNEARIAEIIQSRLVTLRDDQQPIFDKVERFKAMYGCNMQEDSAYPWEYQLTDPEIFPIIRNYLSRMNPAEARISLVGQSEFREVNQQVVNWELNEILITQLLYRIMYSGFMAGHGYGKTGWFYKPALKVKTDRGEKQMSSLQNRADCGFVRFNDLFIPNRNIPEIDSQPYILERVSMRYGDLLDDQKATGRWKEDELKKIEDKKMFSNEVDYGKDLPKEDGFNENTITRSQYVSLICMTTADAEEFWTFEKDTKVILNKDTDNRYWHGHYSYVDFCPLPEDDEFFSQGVANPVADLEIAKSSTLNQLLTNARKAGNSMWMVGPSGKQVPDWMFTDRPNGVVRVTGNLNDYQRLDYNNRSSADLISLRETLKNSIEKTSGISSLYASGAAGQSVNKTARGAEIIDQNVDQNMQLIVSLFGAQILKKLGEHFLELNQQYITEEQTIDITGKHGQYEFVSVKPEQISADFKVKASPERLLKTSPAVRLASLNNTIVTLESAKTIQSNMKPLYEELIEATPGFEDIDPETIIINPEKKVMEAVKAITQGYEIPKVTFDDNHKAMITILQKMMIDNEIPPELLEKFAEYISELKAWMQAQNPNLVVQPPPKPELQPTDPNVLAQTMQQQVQPPSVNPTAALPSQMSMDQLQA